MRRFEFWKLGLQNVIASAMRSGLTVLGISIGVAAVLAVLTLGEAGRVQVKGEMERLGISQVYVTAADENMPLQAGDSAYLQEQLDTEVDELCLIECNLLHGASCSKALVIGCDWDTLCRMMPEIVSGTLPTVSGWLTGSPNVLLGQHVAEALHLSAGEWFSADGKMLRCVGIVQGCQQASSVDVLKAAVVPAELLSPMVTGTVQQLSIHVPASFSSEEVARRASALLAEQRSLAVNTTSMQVQIEAAESILATFIQVLSWVALICMLVGGIGVANILLVSVRERRREIGIMQALGATGLQISGLFLCEALIYALTGGILGLLGGGVLVAAAGKSIGLFPVVKAGDCTIVFLTAVLLGLTAGVAPAIAASRMKPVDALRED